MAAVQVWREGREEEDERTTCWKGAKVKGPDADALEPQHSFVLRWRRHEGTQARRSTLAGV